MPTPQHQRDPRREAARATKPSLTGPISPGALPGSFVAMIDDLLTAHAQLISSWLRIGSSVARRSFPGTPAAATLRSGRHDDPPAPAPAHSVPLPEPAAMSTAERAYEIYLQRGGEPGNPDDDWRRAEAELRAELTG